jgi:hypothetical protein
MKMSWITLSFSPWSMSQTRSTSSCTVMAFLMEVRGTDAPLLLVLVAGVGCVWGAPLLAILVLVVRTWEFWLGQLHPMCPWRLHLKHLPSWHNLFILSSVRAAWARVCPGVRSMALGSLTNHCCHCWQVGFLLFLLLSKKAWTCRNL